MRWLLFDIVIVVNVVVVDPTQKLVFHYLRLTDFHQTPQTDWGVAPHLQWFARWFLLIIIFCYWSFLLIVIDYHLLLLVFFVLLILLKLTEGWLLIFPDLLHSGIFCWLLFVVIVVFFSFCSSCSNWLFVFRDLLHQTIHQICKRLNNSWNQSREGKIMCCKTQTNIFAQLLTRCQSIWDCWEVNFSV